MQAIARWLPLTTLAIATFLTIPTSARALPDLIITSGAYDPTHGRPGDHVTLVVSVKNQGTTATADNFPAVVRAYMTACGSADRWEIDGSDCFQPHLAPNASGTVSCVIVVPNLTPGSYALWAKCDALNDEPESHETNNCKNLGAFVIDNVPCTVAHPQPVYTACSLGWGTSQGWASGKNYIEVTVLNEGQVEADVGAITFSFPAMRAGLDSTLYRAITAGTWTSPVATIVKALPGATIYGSTCAQQPASYLLLEAVWNNWPVGESRTFGIEIDRLAFSCRPGGLELPNGQNPCASGYVLPSSQWDMLRPGEEPPREFWVQYRSALHCLAGGPTACNWYDNAGFCDPLTAPAHAGQITFDQQGWMVKRVNLVAELPERGCSTCVPNGLASWSAIKALFNDR